MEHDWRQVGYSRPVDYDSCNVLLQATHSWGSPLLVKGRKGQFELTDALPLLSKKDHIHAAVQTYERHYSRDQERRDATRDRSSDGVARNGFLVAILRSHIREMALHSFWAVFELAFRVLSPWALRELVRWLQTYDADKSSVREGDGWLWASLVVLFGLGLVLSHHQLFWVGMRLGFGMKQQVPPSANASYAKLKCDSNRL